jgi:hypothetical protein
MKLTGRFPTITQRVCTVFAISLEHKMNDNVTANGLKLALMAALAVAAMVAIAGTLTYLGPMLAGLAGLQ